MTIVVLFAVSSGVSNADFISLRTIDTLYGVGFSVKDSYKTKAYKALTIGVGLKIRKIIGHNEQEDYDEIYGFHVVSEDFTILPENIKKLLLSPDHISGPVLGVLEADYVLECEVNAEIYIIPLSLKDHRFSNQQYSPSVSKQLKCLLTK